MTSLVWGARAKYLNLSFSIRSMFKLHDDRRRFRFTGVFSRALLILAVPAVIIPGLVFYGTTPHKFPASAVWYITGGIVLAISWIAAAIAYLIDR